MEQDHKATGIESAVCADIAKRQQVGIAKYGKTVAENPLSLREWLQHAYEECLDQAVYLKRAISEIESGGNDVLPNGYVSVLGINERLKAGLNKFPENMGETVTSLP